MADERIDILIQAREDVARAVQSAITHLTGLEASAQRSQKEMRQLGDESKRSSDSIRREFGETIRSVDRDLKSADDRVTRMTSSLHQLNEESKDATANMQGATREFNNSTRELQKNELQIAKLSKRLGELKEKQDATADPGWTTRYQNNIDAVEKAIAKAKRSQADWTQGAANAGEAAQNWARKSQELNRTFRERDALLEREEKALERNGRAYRKSIDDALRARRKLEDAERASDADPVGLAQLRRKLNDREREVKNSVERVNHTLRNVADLKIGVDAAEAEKDLLEVEALKDRVGTDITLNVDVDMGAAMAEFATLEAAKVGAGRDVHINVDVDGANQAVAALGRIQRMVEENRHSIAQFDNQIRGMIAFLGVGLAQPLLTGLTALVGELTAVASSAIMAGTAIGAGLTSGIAQALPMVGILAASIQRVSAVMNAVQQFDLMKKQESAQDEQGTTDTTSQMNSLANAQDALKNSQEGVIDANQRLTEAQANLTKTRFEARRELQDLILAEQQAELAARGAALSQEQAQRTLQSAIASGDVAGTSQAQLDYEASIVSRRQADINARRASQDLRNQRRGNALAPDNSVEQAQQQVEDARQGIEDAQEAVEQAKRGIESARASLAGAENDVTGAGAALSFFLSQLTEAERGLYQAILRIRRSYMQNIRPITDNMIESFTYAVNRVNQILNDPKFLKSAETLAEKMSASMDSVTKEFTSDKWVDFWNTMAGAAGRNLKPITETFLTLSNTFRRIADAGRPLFRVMIELIKEAVDDFSRFVGRGKELREFFKEGEKHLRAWWNLARAVVNLFLALVGSSAKEGLKSVRQITEAINEAANWINEHSKRMEQFFRGTHRVMEELGKIILALGDELLKSFSPKSVESLGQVIRRVVIPALGASIRLMGEFFQAVEKLTRNDGVAFFAQMAIGGAIAMKVFKTFGGLIAGLFVNIANWGSKVFGLFSKLGNLITRTSPEIAETVARAGGWGKAFGAVAMRITGLIGLFVFLAERFGVLDDLWKAITDTAKDFADAVIPSIEKVIDAVQRITDSLSGDGGGLGAVLRFIFVELVMHAIIPALKSFGKWIGEYLGGALDFLAGQLNIVADIFSGDFSKIPGHIKDSFGGILRIMLAPFKAIIEFLDGVFGGVVGKITSPFKDAFEILKGIVGDIAGFVGDKFSGIVGGLGDIAGSIVGVFEDIKSPLVDVVNWIISNVINRIPGVEEDTIDVSIDDGHSGSVTQGRSGMVNRRKKLAGYATGGRVGFAGGGAVEAGFNNIKSVVSGGAGILEKLSSANFNFLPDWLQPLAGWIKAKIRDFILSNTPQGKALGFAKDAVGAIGGLFAGGGQVMGPSGVDVIPAWLTRGEFVVTPDGEAQLEAATGMPGILNWLAMRQRPAQGYANGGRAGGDRKPKGPGESARSGDVGDAITVVMDAINSFASEGAAAWNEGWDSIVATTRKSNSIITKMLSDLSKSSIATITRMVKRADDLFGDLRQSGASALKGLIATFRSGFGDLQKVVYTGLSYIGNQTEKALKAFNSSGGDFNLSVGKPSATQKAATGGWIGNQGERGGDVIPALLGRGEAVLNWGHQKVVDPALRAMYGFGLGDMFKRTTAFHGEEAPGGFSGGYAGAHLAGGTSVAIPGFPGEFINSSVLDEALYFARKYNLLITDAFATSGHTGAGHLVTGTAIDIVPASGLSWDETVNRAVADAVSRGLTVLYDGQFGSTSYPNHGEGNHAHIELVDNMGKLGKMATVLAGTAIEIKNQIVEGVGPLKDLAQSSIDMVKKAAEDLIGQQSPGYGPHADVSLKDLPGGLESLNKIFPEGVTLDEQVVAAIAEWAGLPGITFAQIAHGESGYQPHITGTDPGGTHGYGLWQITSGYNDDIIAKYGGPNQMYNPIINALAAKDIYDRQGIGAWYGTTYLTSNNAHYDGPMPDAPQGLAKGGYVSPDDAGEEFATGGEVGKRSTPGAAVPIIAHAREWVVNERQQGLLASALGTTRDALKGIMGFAGGPTSFAGGGEIGYSVSGSSSPLGTLVEKFAEEFYKMFDKIFGRDPTMMTRRFGGFASTLGTTQLAVRSWIESLTGGQMDDGKGIRLPLGGRPDRRHRGPENDEERALREAEDTMDGIKKILNAAMGPIKERGKKLEENIRNTFEGLTGDGGVLDQLSTQFDEFVTQMEIQITNLQVVVRKHGRRVVGWGTQGIKLIEAEMDNLQEQLKMLLDEKGVINSSLKKARKALQIAIKEGDDKAAEVARAAIQNLGIRLRDINGEIAGAQMAILDKMEEKLQAELDKVNSAADRAMSGITRGGKRGIDIRRRIAEAMGFLGRLPDLARDELNVLRDQEDELRRVLRKARRKGNTEMVREIESQLADLQASIVELQAQMITDAQDAIERRAGYRQSRIDIMNRAADVYSGFGATRRGEGIRRNALESSRASILTQRAETADLLEKAIRKGFGKDTLENLREKLADLDMQVAENTLALYQNSIAIRQASIDAINNNQSFLGGVGDSLRGIVETMGQITGTLNQGRLVQIMQSIVDQLQATGQQLRTQLSVFANQTSSLLPPEVRSMLQGLQGLHGDAFVQAITGMDLQGITDMLGGPDSPLAQQFQALLQAIIDNEAALQQNTEELQSIQQQNNIQQFTSTSWQWFRQAMFTGMGGLMPNLSAGTPYYAEGGDVDADGLAYLHSGETVIPARFAGYVKQLMNAGVMAGSLSRGSIPTAELASAFATGRAATISSDMALQARGDSRASELAKLREALLKSSQHIETNIYGRGADDDRHITDTIAFRSRIPTG